LAELEGGRRGSLLVYGLLGLLLGLGVALAEELFFRGWLLQEMLLDYGCSTAVWGSSFLFAMAHFLKPLPEILATWPQFPGLWLMGCCWCRRGSGTKTSWALA
jgi:membrane protease YdiL (CAAX protease family)